MDEATVSAIINLAAVALPFVAAAVVWLERKLSKVCEDLNISNEQGDLIIALAAALYAPIRAKYADDAGKEAVLDRAESIIAGMVATWEDEAGTTAVLERQLSELRAVLAGL
jgi:hypothetical protein